MNLSQSRPNLVMLLSLMLLAGLAGCGPAASDNPPSLGPHASVGGLPPSKQVSLPSNNALNPATQAASPLPLTSRNQIGAAPEKGTVTEGGSPAGGPVQSPKPTDELNPLVVPAWIAKDLDAPDVGTRLRALETWAQSAPPGAVDPLILALENKDERVRARAMELIEQDWARTVDADQ